MRAEAQSDSTAEHGLSGVLKRGAAMSAVALVLGQMITVLQTLILGRLLGPGEVGVFAAGTVAVGVVLVAQGALAQALVQREDDFEGAANTALWATIATGLALSLVMFFISPFIGVLFNSPRVGLIAAATAGVLFLHSCSNVPAAVIQRRFQFRRRLVIPPSVAFTFAVVSVIFAVMGYGAWAMVIGTYASVITALVLNWWLAGWRPSRGRVSSRTWREMARFSFPLLIADMAERGREMLEQVLIGRALGTTELGQYRYAYRIASMPAQAVIQICGYVLYPAFARIAGDENRFRVAYLRALGLVWFAVLPLGVFLAIIGQPLVVLLLGEPWGPAGAATAALAGLGVGTALTSVGWEAIKGSGRSGMLHWLTGLALALGLSLLLLLLPYGLVGIGIALSVTHLAVGFACTGIARSVVHASYRDMTACLGPPVMSATLALAVVFPLERQMIHAAAHGPLVGLTAIVGEFVLFAALYLTVSRWVDRGKFQSIRSGLSRVLQRIRNTARVKG
jgi:O-antigen/teichoic acid export membrane protein